MKFTRIPTERIMLNLFRTSPTTSQKKMMIMLSRTSRKKNSVIAAAMVLDRSLVVVDDKEGDIITTGPAAAATGEVEVSEQSLSVLRRLKNYLRINTSGEARTSNLAFLSINRRRTKALDLDRIVDAFAGNHNNRSILLL